VLNLKVKLRILVNLKATMTTMPDITFFGFNAPLILAKKIHQIYAVSLFYPLNRAWNCRPLLVIVKDCRPYIKGSQIGSN